MRYILIDEKRRQDAINELAGLDISSPMQVDIKPYKENRSNSQNNLYHMWKAPIALATGYPVGELHETLKLNFLGADHYFFNGEWYLKPKSTTEQTIPDMTNFLRKVEALGRFLEVKLRMPDDYHLAMYGR